MARTATVTISAQDSFSATLTKYNQQMGQAEQTTKRAGQSSREAQSGFAGLGTAIQGAMAYLSAQAIISAAEGFNALGVQVHANRVLFDTLTESIGGNERVLQALRDATGNVVSDLDLMAGASQLLRLNIVDNNEDLAQLTGYIQRLKQPTESTTDAIQNFALMLSNESLLRLDSFGISSANVKRAMDELGISFREAVMMEMATQVERLGDAGTVAETGLARLQTRIENITNEAAENFAGVIERAVITLEQLGYIASTGNIPALLGGEIFDAGAAGALEAARVQGVAIAEEVVAGYEGAMTPDVVSRFVISLNQAIEESMRIGQGGALWNDDMEMLMRAATGEPDTGPGSPEFADFLEIADQVYIYRMNLNNAAEEMQRLNDLKAMGVALATEEAEAMAEAVQLLQDQARELERTQTIAPVDAYMTQLGELMGEGATNWQGITLFTPEQAALAEETMRHLENAVEQASIAHELEIISDEEFAGVKQLAEDAKGFADEIKRGADAFNSMNLAELLGQGSGGVMGELTDRLADRMREQGLDPESIQAFIDSANLASGRDTTFSQSLDPFLDTLVNLPPESQITAMQNLIDSMRELQLQGGNPNTIDQEDIAAMAGVEDGKVAFMGFDAENTVSNVIGLDEAKTTIDEMTEGAGQMNSAFDDVGRTIDQIFNRPRTLRLNVVAPAWFEAMMETGGAGGFEAVLEAANRANGGTTPGTERGGGRPGGVQQAQN